MFEETHPSVLSREAVESITVRAAIPDDLMNLIEQAGTNRNEVKAIYLGPKHSLNPYPGKHFIGENPRSSLEFDHQLVLQTISDLKKTAEVSAIPTLYTLAGKLENISLNALPEGWEQISKTSVIKHEETHRSQNVKHNYIEIFEDCATQLKKLASVPDEQGTPEINNDFIRLHTEYQQTYVISEVQALFKGLEFIFQEDQTTNTTLAFALYWMGKVGALFEQYKEGDKSNTILDEVCKRIQEKNMHFYDLNNIINQLSRILLLCGDIELLQKIESGAITPTQVKQMTIAGLNAFIENPKVFLSRRDVVSLAQDKHLMIHLNLLEGELNRLNTSIGAVVE